MSWYHVTLTGAEVAAGKALEYKESFEKAFVAASGPRVMALFQRENDQGDLDLFFTPDCGEHARELLDKWNCTPCDRPSLLGLHLLVGHNEITYYMP